MEITKVAFCIFLATVVMDCFPGPQETELPLPTENAKPSQNPPAQNSGNIKGPVIIEYCQTCSYRGRVNEIKSALQEIYPSVRVVEEEYPIPAPWPLISQLLSYIRIAGLILLFAGDQIFAYMQMNYPPWYLQLKNNKFQAGIFLFFGINLLSNWMVSTGAFEVIYDGTLLYSGLKAGKLPSVEEVVILLNEMN